MRKQISLLSVSFLLILSGCIPALERGEEDVIVVEETDEGEEQQYVITPTIDTPEQFYRNVLVDGKYHRSHTRGNVAHAMNNRIDINQFEVGLLEIAMGQYDSSQYYFQEGQFLDSGTINSWLRRYDPTESRYENGLNPSLGYWQDIENNAEYETIQDVIEDESREDREHRMRYNPLVLSHVMEHNYFYGNEEDGLHLGGVVLGIGLRSVYYFHTDDEDGGRYFHEQPLDHPDIDIDPIEYGKEAAQVMIERLREEEGLEEEPITIALYQEERSGSIVPGSFISMTQVGEGETTIQNWEPIDEQFFFFPSRAANDSLPNQASAFSQFKSDVEGFYDRTIGVVGKGRYKNESLEEMKIEINLQTSRKPEIIALTQFVSGRLSNTFSDQAPVYVYIESVSGPESLIVKYPEEEPYVHIYK
ncbi:CamS family sex pheromone protein [Bacillus shivajii]|uniref:CamS family sex pheromone protein n=1 Tax=Bacillus shivajii TaxID=1983719 RepID=UPI001CF9E0BB|nr:CamS family sex pheromone protein [Bacillus shivajii]UCZ53804.1 CamS family sex pheromone protein [Bacillus shivajii]